VNLTAAVTKLHEYSHGAGHYTQGSNRVSHSRAQINADQKQEERASLLITFLIRVYLAFICGPNSLAH
jgi:hypothetical protein